jgi:outer membrane protein assembly factor BamB
MQEGAGPSMASPLIYADSIYILQGRGGTISCYDAQTGAPRYKEERLKGARQFWASPWGYDGKVFCLDQNGTTFVVEAGENLNLLATNKIKGKFWSSPAMSEGGIVLRGTDRIYCIKN